MDRPPPARDEGTAGGLVGVLLLWALALLVGTLVAASTLGGGDQDLDTAAGIIADDVVPPLFGAVVIAVVLTRRHWWRQALGDAVPARSWVWVVPAIVTAGALVTTDWTRLAGAGAALVVSLCVGVLVVALTEELLFRGVVLTGFRARWGEPLAATWTVLVFALAHSVASLQVNPLQIVSTATGGVVYYLTKRVSGSVWPAVLVHALVDLSLYSIALGPGEAEDNRAPVVVLASVLASLVALVGVKRVALATPREV